jgi:hypothetical protein
MPLNSKGLQCSWTDEQLDHAKVRRMVPQISISKKSPSIAKDCSVLELMNSWIMLRSGGWCHKSTYQRNPLLWWIVYIREWWIGASNQYRNFT